MMLDNKRITKNTAVLYLRMLVSMFVSFYTSRIILEILGVEDFGIYNVVGGAASIVTFFTGSLTNVSQRYFNIGLGHEDLKETKQYFNQFILIYIVVTILIIIVGEALSSWIVKNLLVIPIERISAAMVVYQFSLFILALSILQIPFVSLVIAHEEMRIFAWISLGEVFAKLGILYIIPLITGDNLSLYAILLFLIALVVFIVYVVYSRTKFKECVWEYYFNYRLACEMFNFIGCNVYGCFAYSMAQQGTNILINLFFGPSVNAARAIAIQVSNGVYRFSENIVMAIRPPIVKLYAQGEIQQMLSLSLVVSRYCMFVNTLITIPLLFNIHYILRVWLKAIPDYTAAFITIILMESYFNILNQTLTILVNATGRLKRNQIYGRTFTLMTLPVSYLLLMFLKNPVIPIVVNLFFTILYWGNNLLDDRSQLGLSMKVYVKKVIFPTVYLIIVMSVCCYGLTIMIPNSFIGFVVTSLLTIMIGCLIIFFVLMTNNEKVFICMKIKNKLMKK